MQKNWTIRKPGNATAVNELAEALGIEKSLASLLVQRDIYTYEQARAFFRPDLANLHDPFLMKDMEKAIDRIETALKNNEQILIYGDYDVDGTTSVALVYSFLSKRHSSIGYYIPDRYNEGYGVSYKGIDYASANGYSLVIALDCGIKAVDKIEYARERGVDFIICDHHTAAERIPDAVAVLDPKRVDCSYPFKELSGCGVGFKLLQAFCIKRNIDFDELYAYLDLVVVSIASDIVPLCGENRILASFGLKQLSENPSVGLKAIIQVSGMDKKSISIEDIVFKIGPRINAAGRIESGRSSVDLLTSDNLTEAIEIAATINEFNNTRRNIDNNITTEALKFIVDNKQLASRKSTVLFNPAWHKGVIGIVASRLIDTYYRPTVILTESNGFVTGSARSVPGFDLYKAIDSCSDILENFGGHMYAAGLTLKRENLQAFTDRFEKFVSENIEKHQLIPSVEIDTQIELSDITPRFYRIIKQFQPFGPENMAPVFMSENVADNGMGRTVGNNNEHLKLHLIQEADPFKVYPAIGFNMGAFYPKIAKTNSFDICYNIDENEYRGVSTLQLKIKDIKFD